MRFLNLFIIWCLFHIGSFQAIAAPAVDEHDQDKANYLTLHGFESLTEGGNKVKIPTEQMINLKLFGSSNWPGKKIAPYAVGAFGSNVFSPHGMNYEGLATFGSLVRDIASCTYNIILRFIGRSIRHEVAQTIYRGGDC